MFNLTMQFNLRFYNLYDKGFRSIYYDRALGQGFGTGLEGLEGVFWGYPSLCYEL
jgi:hypothetical protein